MYTNLGQRKKVTFTLLKFKMEEILINWIVWQDGNLLYSCLANSWGNTHPQILVDPCDCTCHTLEFIERTLLGLAIWAHFRC